METNVHNWKHDIRKFGDVYGIKVVHQILKNKGYNYISYRDKSYPSDGSPIVPIDLPESVPYFLCEVKKIVLHMNGDVTVITNQNFNTYIK